MDANEVFNPGRVIIVHRGGGRFAGKYRIIGGAGSIARGPGARLGEDCMRDFDGPEGSSSHCATIAAKPSSLRYAQVQALKSSCQTEARPCGSRTGHWQVALRSISAGGRDLQGLERPTPPRS